MATNSGPARESGRGQIMDGLYRRLTHSYEHYGFKYRHIMIILIVIRYIQLLGV